MNHSMFRLRDLAFLPIPVGVIALCVTTLIYNLGEDYPVGAWVSLGAAIACCIAVIIAWYVKRWMWVRMYRYSVYGVGYFFEDGAMVYEQQEVVGDSLYTLGQWSKHHREKGEDNLAHSIITDSRVEPLGVCVFKPEFPFPARYPGMWDRLVAGLQVGNTIYVGQGGRPVKRTAHGHELSHLYINRAEGRQVGELESHEIFKQVGV